MFGLALLAVGLFQGSYGALMCGDSVSGSINSSEVANFTFNLTNKYPVVQLDTCNSSFDTYLYVWDSSGTLIEECDDCGGCGTRTILNIKNLTSGVYTIGVTGCCPPGPTSYGNFTLDILCGNLTEFETTDTPMTTSKPQNVTYSYQGALNCSDSVYGDITSYEIDVWGFYLNEEYPAVYLNTCRSDYDTYIYVRNSSGGIIYECDDCGDCGTRTIATLTDFGPGFYDVLISGCCGDPHNAGNYSLNVSCTNDTITTTTETPYVTRASNFSFQGGLSCGDFVSGDIGSYEIDLYYFDLYTNYSNITLNTCGSNYDTYIYVYNSSLGVIYECDDCGPCGTRTIASLGNFGPGYYYVGISGCCGNPHSNGTYNLTVVCEGGSTIEPIVTATTTQVAQNVTYSYQGALNCSDSVSGDITSYEIDVWGFYLNEEYPSVILNTCGSDYDTYIYVRNSSGDTIYSCDDCGDCGTRTVATLGDFGPGYYYVLVSGCCGDPPHDYGNYVLNVSCTNETVTTTTETPGMTQSANFTDQGSLACGDFVTGDITAYEIDLYSFAVCTNYSNITLNTCGSNYDTYIYIYNASLDVIYSCDDCGNCGTRTVVSFGNVSEGYYYVGISGCCGDPPNDYGTYNLSVTCEGGSSAIDPCATTTTEPVTSSGDDDTTDNVNFIRLSRLNKIISVLLVVSMFVF